MDLSERHIQSWMNAVEDFLIIIDQKGIIIKANGSWSNFCNEHHAPETAWKAGSDYFGHLSKLGKSSELQAVQEVVNQKKSEHLQMYLFTLEDGVTQWFSAKVSPVTLEDGSPGGAVIFLKPVNLHTIQPITAESVLESMTECFLLVDQKFNINYVNEIAEKTLQITREEVIGKSLWEVFPEAIGTIFNQQYHRALEKQETVQFEEYFEPLGLWVLVRAYPLKKGGLAIYFQDINERKKTEDKLVEYAYYDYLTGLPNRRLLKQKAESLIEQKKKFSLFYINLDNLKLVNALHTFNAGDKVMQRIAEKLKVLINDQCQVGRIEGDEFLVIYEPQLNERLDAYANELKKVFNHPFILDDFQAVSVNASIGIACYPYDSTNIAELISFSETAMYEAKKQSGSSHAYFRPTLNVERARKIKIEESLKGDLFDLGFYFTLQPQIDGSTGKIIGVEVLSRWNHPDLGELSPLEFIEVAESSSTIAPLTYHLLAIVFAQMKDWENRYGWRLKTAINMTPSLLANPIFFEDFFSLIEQYDIQPELLEIEITEQTELAYSEQIMENLLLCNVKGISIAIDDFGTGFSTFAYLTHFPINKIKIDKFFIQKIGQDKKSEAVLTSIIHLANSIECELLAEGVERLEELAFLKAHNCNVYQGYFYDKPLKVSEFEEKYLRKRHQFQLD